MSDTANIDTSAWTEQQILDEIQKRISDNPVMLFMKGTPDFPMCGFSGRTTEILRSMGVEFGAMNILNDPRVRQVLSSQSNWPTIPQVFVDGKFIGGCDIVVEMYSNGELEPMVKKAVESATAN